MSQEKLSMVVAIKKEHDLAGPIPYEIRLNIRDL